MEDRQSRELRTRVRETVRVGWQRYRLVISYDGGGYHGWQGQTGGIGVQDAVELAIERLVGVAVDVVGSSRTDAGVHAMGLVAHVDLPIKGSVWREDRLLLAVNACLPDDIRVNRVEVVAADFHARYDAVSKEYRYYLWNHPAMCALERGRMWHVPWVLDFVAMESAARMIVGRKDFRAFTCNRGGVLEDAVREVTRCQIERDGERVVVVIEGGGFLYKMCRGIVGTLVHVGRGKIPLDGVPGIIANGDRTQAGENAPAHGLVLWQVRYAAD